MALFESGEFVLASGQKSNFKIECDALTIEDWVTLAAMLVNRVPPFDTVVGVPRGGSNLARAMEEHITSRVHRLLVVDDVWTTGGSINKTTRNTREVLGPIPFTQAVVFARNPPPDHLVTLFTLSPEGQP